MWVIDNASYGILLALDIVLQVEVCFSILGNLFFKTEFMLIMQYVRSQLSFDNFHLVEDRLFFKHHSYTEGPAFSTINP